MMLLTGNGGIKHNIPLIQVNSENKVAIILAIYASVLAFFVYQENHGQHVNTF